MYQKLPNLKEIKNIGSKGSNFDGNFKQLSSNS